MSRDSQRVDFDPVAFSLLINEQGYDVVHEKANMCSCFKESIPNAGCDVCKGSGWVYNTSEEIKAIMTAIGKNIEFGREGLGRIGTVNVTVLPEVRLAFRDRLTLLEGKIIYMQTVTGEGKTTVKLKYPIIDIEEVAALGVVYSVDTHYTVVDGNLNWVIGEPEQYAVRYTTYPRWMILNFPNIVRGVQAKLKRPDVEYEEMPVRAIAKLEFMVTQEDLVI